MRPLKVLIFFLTAFFACTIGKLCGMGGGVIIKPVLDALNVMNVSSINFVSGCTVLGMSAWSVGKNFIKKESTVDLKASTPLGIGAAFGGIVGKKLFQIVAASFADANKAGGIQAFLLIVATLATLIYTINKSKIRSQNVKQWYISIIIGFFLGMLGAFLGIGGGPFNMAVLFIFFSMSTKTAAQNSLFIILISQLSSMIVTLISGNIPQVSLFILIGMIVCGVLGSEIGNRISKRISDRFNTVLFEFSMILVIIIASYNLRLLF